MKVLHFHRSLGAGGIESVVCNLANAMAETEDVTVGTVFHQSPDSYYFSRLGERVHRISLNKVDDTKKPIKEILMMPFLIGKGHYDIVHIHGYFYYYILAVLLLHKKTKFYYTLHSVAQYEGPPWDKRVQRIKTLFFKKNWMRPITISEMARDSFEKMYGRDSRLIYNGVPSPSIGIIPDYRGLFNFSNDTRVFLHPGRITYPKNQLVLCKVFDRLICEGFDIALLIAGENHDNGIFSSLEPYFSDRIRYIGVRQDLTELMSFSDGLCLPSIFEGFSLVLVEGLAVGCVPICTKVGVAPEVIIDGANGILSESPSEDDYYSAMNRFLALSSEELDNMRSACKHQFIQFEIHNAATQYLQYYRES